MRRARLRDAAFRSQGITFTVYDEGEGIERTFPMDLLPRIVPADEWDHIEAGLVERGEAPHAVLHDPYVGGRAAPHGGVIPPPGGEAARRLFPEAVGIPGPPRGRG